MDYSQVGQYRFFSLLSDTNLLSHFGLEEAERVGELEAPKWHIDQCSGSEVSLQT
ncbi:hypothetical protein EGR_11126 [Echinococcus granulosus]|uniref:Uncharacterized protein n=1 Tax=Echinococcus granulosus TaxID=6210 RepID=W6TZ66_ECHGR|nr:hypothetical protein EGR_11126 [Echinococcus granulosus]EUB54018.1 hypothetical protein EGR_11126 [Echinococcus granulosus]